MIASATDRDGLGARAIRLIAILLLFYALAYMDRQIITLLVGPIKADLNINDVSFSFLQGLGFVLFYATCGIPIGILVDRYPKRHIIFTGVIIWSCFTMASGLAQNYNQLLFARFGVGAGEAALLPAAYALISQAVAPRRLGAAMSTFSLGAIVGGGLALGLGGIAIGALDNVGAITLPLLGTLVPWRLLLVGTGLIGIVLAPLVYLIRETNQPTKDASAAKAPVATSDPLDPPTRHWRFYLAHISGFSLLCFVAAAISAWSPAFLMRHYDWPVAQVGLVLGSMHMVAGVVGMLGGGLLADALFRRGYLDAHLRLYLFALPVFGTAAWLALTSSNIIISIAGLTIVSLIAPFIGVAATALQIATAPQHRGKLSALFLLVYNLFGFGLGPTTAAWLAEHQLSGPQSIGMALAIVAAFATPLAFLCMAAGLRPMRRAVAAMTVPAKAEPAE